MRHSRRRSPAYAIQHEALRESDARIGAWKIGARAPDALAAGAPIDAALVHDSPARLPFDSFFRVLVELELAFRFAYALPPRTDAYSREEVFASIGGIAVAPGSRRQPLRAMAQSRLARTARDAQNNGVLIVSGMEPYDVVAPSFDFLAPRLEFTLDGLPIAPAALANPAGDARELLPWLVNHCSRMGLTVEPFWTITTRSYTGAYRVEGSAMLPWFDRSRRRTGARIGVTK